MLGIDQLLNSRTSHLLHSRMSCLPAFTHACQAPARIHSRMSHLHSRMSHAVVCLEAPAVLKLAPPPPFAVGGKEAQAEQEPATEDKPADQPKQPRKKRAAKRKLQQVAEQSAGSQPDPEALARVQEELVQLLVAHSQPPPPERPARCVGLDLHQPNDTRKKYASRAYHAAKQQALRNDPDCAWRSIAQKAHKDAIAAWDAARA